MIREKRMIQGPTCYVGSIVDCRFRDIGQALFRTHWARAVCGTCRYQFLSSVTPIVRPELGLRVLSQFETESAHWWVQLIEDRLPALLYQAKPFGCSAGARHATQRKPSGRFGNLSALPVP